MSGIEYRNIADKIKDSENMAEALSKAKKDEHRLTKSGKIKPRRLDNRTVVVSSYRTFKRIKNNE